jgi:hypothetical protein
MDRYITQLIEDLKEVAQNPPMPAYIEPPPHLDELPDIAELALVPFKSIEEWTGVDAKKFPPMFHLTPEQMKRVNKVIFEVFESLHIELIDVPEGFPPELLYDVLTTSWDEPVQYLPSSGFDLELCTGDPMTCPYGEYCDCGDDDDFLEDDDLPTDSNELDDDRLPF